MRKPAWGAVAVLLLVAACGEPRVESRQLALDAYCEAMVIGTGLVDVETDYLAHVVACENGGASFEALKAQAIAARSYLYYRLDSTGDIGDGTGDQVYTCGRAPTLEHQMAVDATSGQVLQYMGTQVAAFYVAGALQNPPTCIGGPTDPTGTEPYVTYNLGKSGDQIDQTTLGFVDPQNYANRGCMSQNGSDCLADEGFDVSYMLRFYYGEDIEVVTAEGPCILGSVGPDAGIGTDAGPDAGGPGVDDGGDLGGGCGVAADASLAASLVLALLLLGGRRRYALALVAVAAAVLEPGAARATYSIVAADEATDQVGGSGTSCINGNDITVIYGSVPGTGAIHAQALLSTLGRDEGVRLLQLGTAPADVIAAIANASFDSNYQRRQYGVVDLQGRAAGFTGTQNGDVALDVQGNVDTFVYSAQGNILTSRAVIDQAEAAFRDGGGCDLADRLMLALEAGADNGEGDSRCTPGGIPSDSAFIHVDDADGTEYVHLTAVNLSSSPVADLRAAYDAWRADNPCAAPPAPDAGVGEVDAGDSGGDGGDGDGGCGCSSGGPGGAAWLIVVAVLVGRRRSS